MLGRQKQQTGEVVKRQRRGNLPKQAAQQQNIKEGRCNSIDACKLFTMSHTFLCSLTFRWSTGLRNIQTFSQSVNQSVSQSANLPIRQSVNSLFSQFINCKNKRNNHNKIDRMTTEKKYSVQNIAKRSEERQND